MDFLGALGRDCTAESDPAPRPLPLARPAASVPVAPPASADQIRRRFEDQRRELAPRAGRSLSPREPPRAGFVLRSGAEAVAHQERSPCRRSSAARDDKRESRRNDRHGAARSPLSPRLPRREADPVTVVCIVIIRPLTVHLASGHLPARRLGVGPQLRARPLLQSANGSTPLVAGTVFLAASVSKAHLARSRLCARAQVGVRVVGDGGVTVPAEKRVQRRPQWSAVFWIGLMTWRRSFVARVRERPLPAGMGFVGAGGGPPWAQFAPPRPLPAPRDLAVSSHRALASALLPPMKEVPTATLARLWSLAASRQSLERILQESFDSMPLWLNTSGMLAAVEADRM
ncbi:unnamed protein product [Closterium sp. NIES-64]|nr:unnamed protein product [Closterium sp. NIES-64]